MVNQVSGINSTKLYTVDTFPYNLISETPTIKRGRKNHAGKRRRIKDVVCAFDIETSGLHTEEQAFMYIWCFAFGTDIICTGRTWEEFLDFTYKMSTELGDKETIAVYVHNLSYEFQFMRGVYDFNTEEVFAIDKRKVLKCSMFAERIEFRCAYYQSNMSLEEFTIKMDVEHKKLSGDKFDYRKMRYPWTELSDEELRYCYHDVIGLVECIERELKDENDNLETIPPTSTGYVRRDTKKAMETYMRPRLQEMLPDFQTFIMLDEAFRGGNCHANRYYADQILRGVKSYDRASSYPDVICNCEFPMKPFKTFDKPSIDWAIKLMEEYHRALLMRIELTNVSLREPWFGCPYISRHKCAEIVGGKYDNGRVLEAVRLVTTVTDIDLAIIVKQYNFGITVIDMKKARYGKLPQEIIDVNIEYFKRKTELKGIKEQEVFYNKSKNKLNSVYGMFAQSPVKQTIDFINNEFLEREEDPRILLENSNRKAFLNYAWGVWVTAWARYRLEEGIDIAGRDFVYADTDSVKFIDSGINSTKFEEYNEMRISESKKNGAYAVDRFGKTQYMGVYEVDAEYDEFKTMGAKKYAFTKDGKIKLTVAGVNKKKGGPELEEHGGLEAFKEGFIFRKAGGTESVYNDEVDRVYEIDGHRLHITPNVYIKDSTYTLGLTGEYFNLIYKCKQMNVQ